MTARPEIVSTCGHFAVTTNQHMLERKESLKTTLLSLLIAFVAFLMFSISSTSRANLITFDDISLTYMTTSGGVVVVGQKFFTDITNGYHNLNWGNFSAGVGLRSDPFYGTNGGYYGMVSVSNIAFNDSGNPAEIDATSANFNFLSVYLTGVWNSNLNIEAEGFRSGTLLYDTTVVASATAPTLFAFNYLDIDRLTFNSFGGQNAGFPNGEGELFAMDNLSVEFVPEPSSLLLATIGVLLLWPLLKRNRV